MSFFLTLAVAGLTLALIFLRPRGLHEAWAAVLGGGPGRRSWAAR